MQSLRTKQNWYWSSIGVVMPESDKGPGFFWDTVYKITTANNI